MMTEMRIRCKVNHFCSFLAPLWSLIFHPAPDAARWRRMLGSVIFKRELEYFPVLLVEKQHFCVAFVRAFVRMPVPAAPVFISQQVF
jgi:hypothetical protein